MHLSRVRIRSEHGIGFLKGRFQSLKGIRVNINSRKRHRYACAWVVACIAIHSFALRDEQGQKRATCDDDDGAVSDPFIGDGVSSLESSSHGPGGDRQAHRRRRRGELSAGEKKPERLKRALFRHLREPLA